MSHSCRSHVRHLIVLISLIMLTTLASTGHAASPAVTPDGTHLYLPLITAPTPYARGSQIVVLERFDGTYVYVFGEIVNPVPGTQATSDESVTTYDAAGTEIETVLVQNKLLSTLPGQPNPFVAPLYKPDKVASFSVNVISRVGPITFWGPFALTLTARSRSDSPRTVLSGTWRNDRSDALDNIIMAATFYDADGYVVFADGRGDFFTVLQPGQTVSSSFPTDYNFGSLGGSDRLQSQARYHLQTIAPMNQSPSAVMNSVTFFPARVTRLRP